MAKSPSLLPSMTTLMMVVLVMISSSSMVQGGIGDLGLSWVTAGGGGGCHGSMAECMAERGEFEMDSEINRRILATTDYISYQALQRNTVPCSRRGASYYNCQAGAQANPYNRGCSAITRCRS